jgi:dephospho-CoA kinase
MLVLLFEYDCNYIIVLGNGLLIVVNKKERFQRLLKRNEPRDPKTWQEFLEQDREEEKIFQLSKTCKLADYRITNNETIEKLFQKLDKIIKAHFIR